MTRALLLVLVLPLPVLAQGYRPWAPSRGSASTSEPTFTSTQTDGGAAFVVPTGAKVCHDGAACGVYTTYDGGTLGLVGAEVEIPQGITNSQPVNPDTIITPYSVVAQAASGQAAFKVAQTGARVYLDVGGNIYCYSDGARVICGSTWAIPAIETDTIGSYTANKVVTTFNFQFFPLSSLGTCNGSSAAGGIPEGTVKMLSGASTSSQSRLCACVSNGAGSPAYTWINTGCPNTAGTSTTCPACP